MRKLTLALLIFASDMFVPPYPPCGVTDAASVAVSAAKFVKPTGSQTVIRRRRKRIKPVAHRKPPMRYACPDVVRPMSAAEVEAERRAKEAVKLVTWF